MSELPKERVEVSPPFTYTGMDCFGPFIIKRGRKEHKRYGLLLTCLSSRAVHIEMLEDLSTDSFINALRCFISLRGAVCQLHCDHGTNFVGAERKLRESLALLNNDTIQQRLSARGIKWSFNPPFGSHNGGAWERLIRTVKKVLYSVVRQQMLDDESLHTVLCEVETILNDRPLTAV